MTAESTVGDGVLGSLYESQQFSLRRDYVNVRSCLQGLTGVASSVQSGCHIEIALGIHTHAVTAPTRVEIDENPSV